MIFKKRTYIKDDDQGRIFLTGRLGKPCRCGWVAENLCDYPVGEEKTCDARLCEQCGNQVAPDTHYCADHHHAFLQFRNAGGIKKVLENIIPFKSRWKP